MLKVVYSGSFKKDLKHETKKGHNIDKIKEIVEKLANNEKLPDKNRDHALTGNYNRL